MRINRRKFMVGCSAAIASMANGQLSHLAFGNPKDEPNQDILLVVFLRGGIDGLSLVPVIAGPDREYYEVARSELAIPVRGANAAILLDDQFGLHSAARPLYELYQDKKLAIIHAAGLQDGTRSHFDAMALMELGTHSVRDNYTGWLTRHMLTSGRMVGDALVPAVAVGNLQPTSFTGSTDAIGMMSPDDFGLGGSSRYEEQQRAALRQIYSGHNWIHAACQQTLEAIDKLELANPGDYVPSRGVTYPSSSFSRNLQSVAQMIKLDLGLTTATIDYGGWDTHEAQGEAGEGYFYNRFAIVAQALNAFYADIGSAGTSSGYRVTTVLMSEFGRSLKANGSGGTDHGHGNVMMVIGDNVKGGSVYGEWPGLHVDQLYDNRDLAITTDYRQVLSEVLIKQFANPNLGDVFPGFSDYQPLDFMDGESALPSYDATLEVIPEIYRANDGNETPAVYLPMITN